MGDRQVLERTYSFLSSLTIFKISESLSVATALPLFQSTICARLVSKDETEGMVQEWVALTFLALESISTYHRSLEVLSTLLELLQCLLLIACTRDNGADVAGANVF